MSWTRYLFHDYFTAQEFNRIEDKFKRQRMQEGRTTSHLMDRVDELEAEVGRLSLVCHALAETCLAKELVSRDELNAMMAKVDLEDGVLDGQHRTTRSAPPQTTEEVLHELEKKPQPSPREFLSNLEHDSEDSSGDGDAAE